MNFALRDWDVLCFVLQGVCALMRVCVWRGEGGKALLELIVKRGI